MNAKTEEGLHLAICKYIKLQYPHVIFTSEGSGVRLTKGQSVKEKLKRSGTGLPDIWIVHPDKPEMLFLEVKKESPFKKNGELKQDTHLQEQEDIIWQLIDKGHYADFVWDFDRAKAIIDNFLKQ